MIYKCPFCHHVIEVNYPKVIHAGFSDCGFLYCNKSGDLITWSSYDKTYESLVPGKHPWMLSKKEQALIEGNLIDCPCGGKFTFAAHPRCPNCNAEIPDILPDDIHWVELKNLIDGEKENIWKLAT
jgi:hypothetical protein